MKHYDYENESIRPIGGKVYLKLILPPTITEGGIHLLDGTQTKNAEQICNRGEVMGVGEDVKLNIKVGDTVVFDPRGLDPFIRSNYKDFNEAFIQSQHIFAVVDPKE